MTSRNAPRCALCSYKFKSGQTVLTDRSTGQRAHESCVKGRNPVLAEMGDKLVALIKPRMLAGEGPYEVIERLVRERDEAVAKLQVLTGTSSEATQ